MFKIKNGPTVFFDVDDTLLMWGPSEEQMEHVNLLHDRFTFTHNGRGKTYIANRHNIDLLVDYAIRGHTVVVWSAGGSDWAETVVKTLGLGDFVACVCGKPQTYVDDVKDPTQWMGKHQYITLDGVVARPYPQQKYPLGDANG